MTIGEVVAKFASADIAHRRRDDHPYLEDEVQTLRRLLSEAREHVAALLGADHFSNEQMRAQVRARRWLEAVRR